MNFISDMANVLPTQMRNLGSNRIVNTKGLCAILLLFLPATEWHERMQRPLFFLFATEALRVELLRLFPEPFVVVQVLRGINQRRALGYYIITELHVLLCFTTIDVRDWEHAHALFDGHFQIRNVVQIVDRRCFVTDSFADVFTKLSKNINDNTRGAIVTFCCSSK